MGGHNETRKFTKHQVSILIAIYLIVQVSLLTNVPPVSVLRLSISEIITALQKAAVVYLIFGWCMYENFYLLSHGKLV